MFRRTVCWYNNYKVTTLQYSFRILFVGVVHFRGSPFGESVFCPSPYSYIIICFTLSVSCCRDRSQGLGLWRLVTLASLGASCPVGTRSCWNRFNIALQVHLIMCNSIPIRGPLNALWIYIWLMCNWKFNYNINWCGTLCILLKEVSSANSPLKLIVTHFQFKRVIKIYFNDIVNKVNMH